MAKIVYVFGAGASAQAIPIVSDMLIRMDFFMFCMEFKLNHDSYPDKVQDKLFERINLYKIIIQQAKNHLSIDTYAKKLFLLNDNITLLYLRELISIYFLFEHFDFENYDTYIESYLNARDFQDTEIDSISERLNRYSTKQIDPRYDAFIAGISNKNLVYNLFLPKNVSIVSWNYDLQFEKAMSVYDKFNARGIDFLFNPCNHAKQEIIFEFSNEYIKLNGSSGHVLLNEEDLDHKEISNPDCKTNIEQYNVSFKEEEDILSLLSDLLLKNIDSRNINRYRPLINFAWEENKLSKANVLRACQKMEDADSIVIIGYSFPTFNREIDCLLFSNLHLGKNCKIYVQTVSEKEFISIRTRMLGISSGINEKDIEFIDDVSQFYIPFEFSREVDKQGTVSHI